MDLNKYQNIYFLGIKGAGMTALVQILHSMGKNIWGSDVPEYFFTEEVLKKEGLKVLKFSPKNITKKIDLVIYSTAYNQKNSAEYRVAKAKKIVMASYPQALGLLFAGKYGIAVCGTHGKTTTTAMLGYVMQQLGVDPLVVVGSTVEQLGGNARFGAGQYSVIEADEYQNKLHYYSPRAVILTSADFDHPDYFKNQSAYSQVFINFVKRIPRDGVLIAFAGDAQVRKIAKYAKCKVVFYGTKAEVAKNKNLKLQVIGEHNLWNALGVLVLIKELGLDVAAARKILANFKGCKRRFEFLGEYHGAKIYDDYAHHPTEIQKMLQAALRKFPKQKIYAVFQAHTFTRTKALIKDFGQSFALADEVVVLDIFGSAREAQGTISVDQLVAEINKNSHNAAYHGEIKEVIKYLAGKIKRGDVVITVGAGENWRVGVGLVKLKN